MIEFLSFALTGRLFLFLLRKFPPFRSFMGKWEYSQELFDCDLCLGFWVYLALSPFFKMKIDMIENKVVRNTVLAGVTSFLTFLAAQGWKEHFEILVIEDEFSDR